MAAYDVALLSECYPRIISILNAAPGTFDSTVSGQVGAFSSQAEITAALIEADMDIVTQGYFQSANDSLANRFQITSAPLSNQDNIPFHHGTLNRIEVARSVLAVVPGDVNITDNAINISHGMNTGDLVSWVIVSGGLPSPFTVLANYYIIKTSDIGFQLATSINNAMLEIPIDITAVGSGDWFLIAWAIGVEAKNVDEITNANGGMSAYVGTGSYNFLYKENSGVIFTTAGYCRVSYPEYIKTSVLQANKNETTLIIAMAIKILTKNASPAPFPQWTAIADEGMRELITDGVFTDKVTDAPQ